MRSPPLADRKSSAAQHHEPPHAHLQTLPLALAQRKDGECSVISQVQCPPTFLKTLVPEVVHTTWGIRALTAHCLPFSNQTAAATLHQSKKCQNRPEKRLCFRCLTKNYQSRGFWQFSFNCLRGRYESSPANHLPRVRKPAVTIE